MATAVGDQTWRASDPERIDRDLALLWQDLARAAPLTRAVLSNLVVFIEDVAAGAGPGGRATLDEVVQRHPSRAIVLEHQREQNDARASLSASIGVLTFGAADARYGVEQILVRSACSEASLPSIVRRLLLGDVPTTVWWTEDLSRTSPLAPLLAMGRQFVFDSRCWIDVRRGVRALEPFIEAGALDLADLNWRRLEPVRRALVHHLQTASHDLPLAPVRIGHAAGEAALAWLLAGWLEARLSVGVPLDVSVTAFEQGDAILALSIGPEPQSIAATLTTQDVVIQGGSGGTALTIPVPRESEADAVAAELRSLARDSGLHDTLGALARRFRAVPS